MRSTEEDFLFDDEATEALAAYAHDAWAGWMRYLFSKAWKARPDDFRRPMPGDVVIPAELVERWVRQMNSTYAELPDNEKESDRAEAAKMIDIVTERDP